MFTPNVGNPERILRIIMGIVLFAIAFVVIGGGVWQWVAAGVGVVLIVTGIAGVCWLYSAIGWITGNKRLCPTCSPREAAERDTTRANV